MAANFWRGLFAVEWMLATLIAFGIGCVTTVGIAWLLLFACAIYLGLQYLLVLVTMALSWLAPGGARTRPDVLQVARAALSEPVYFWLARLAMMTRPGPFSPAGPVSGASPPLLLVHGLVCNAGLWRWMLPRLRAAGFTYIYAVNLEPLDADIDALQVQLESELKRIHQAHPQAPITILGHSMGGLVARAALRAVDPAIIGRIVTVATPHHGATIARLVRSTPVSQMACGSPWLASLNELQEGKLPVPLTSISSQEDNLVAPSGSPRLRGAKHIELRGFGHFGPLVSARGIDVVLAALREPA